VWWDVIGDLKTQCKDAGKMMVEGSLQARERTTGRERRSTQVMVMLVTGGLQARQRTTDRERRSTDDDDDDVMMAMMFEGGLQARTKDNRHGKEEHVQIHKDRM